MSRRICLFGELDTYTGSFPQSIAALPLLVQQLKIACLLYDEVIVNTNVLFDHALTLPAFKKLSPFTRSGILWTTAIENEGLPVDYVLTRAKRVYGENLNKGVSKKSKETLHKIIEQWQAISPMEWRLTRKVSQQQQNATKNIIVNIKNMPLTSKQAIVAKEKIIRLAGYMQDNGVFNRNEMIARLGGIRELVTEKELASFFLIIQGEYMNQGAHNKGNVSIALFPGKYIQHLQQNHRLFQAQPLPTDLNTLEKVAYRLHNSGFPLNILSSLAVDDLFYLSQSKNWKRWRRYVLSECFSIEAIKEMQSLKKAHTNLLNILAILLKNIDYPAEEQQPSLLPLLLPSPWLVAGLGLIGNTTSQDNKQNKTIATLDLNSRQFSYKNKKIILEKPYVTLISLLASTGNKGMPIETIKQLDIEIDLIKRTFHNTWRSPVNDKKELDIARLNRLNVAKNRLNKKLHFLDIKIQVEQGEGLWKLIVLSTEENLAMLLKGTPWNVIDKDAGQQQYPTPPKGLTKRHRQLWNYFIQRHTSFIAAKAIALEIDRRTATVKQISDVMYKFKQQLKGTRYSLIKSYQGEYCLLYK